MKFKIGVADASIYALLKNIGKHYYSPLILVVINICKLQNFLPKINVLIVFMLFKVKSFFSEPNTMALSK